ncbi:HMA2 domain-containing protein [Bacillus weihaiensis]|uniref:Metal ABC transporter ATPase n=1 Tax=Bacillus weihaiensis TaxID=1547283 RepID=A0A1L3MRB3_9BACI|nr:hypothetical protein [Bacillus weihaiensis]APH04861.1 hypothetical protein A9C19_08935 [Bacillus weihaiensis]
MLTKIKNTLVHTKIEKLLKKYEIIVKHYLPGRIRLGFSEWEEKSESVITMLDELRKDPDIYSIEFTKETGSVLILFNKEEMNNRSTLERWLRTIEKYA